MDSVTGKMKDDMPISMSSCIIVTGGRVDICTLDRVLVRHQDESRVIAVDKGLTVCNRVGIVPDIIIGDFDSAGQAVVNVYRKLAKKRGMIRFIELDVHKDVTDTHAAIVCALEAGARNIYIVGATGTRLDHTMANIALLKLCADAGAAAYIEDDHNVITMLSKGCDIKKPEGYDYVSFIPYGGEVHGVSICNMEYPAYGVTFACGDSLGVSNRITEDDARIDFDDGYMLMIYSRD